jgi:hypothetical protein
MQLEISEAARDRLEHLVTEGIYPSIEDAAEAAIFSFDPQNFDWEKLSAAHRLGISQIESGRFRVVDQAFVDELRSRVTRKQR